MKRLAYQQLLEWKNSSNRKPLIIRGARQVGKTWLMKYFAQQEYASIVYVNFESSTALQKIFMSDFSIERILLALQIETGIKAEPGKTLIILDEIQEADRGLTSLKYFHENAPEYHVIAAGSYLGIAMHKHASFPVGKVDFLDLYPLSFTEFLYAMQEDGLVELLEYKKWNLITTFKDKFTEYLKQYYYLGGMPEVVASFSLNKNFQEARNIQRQLLIAYEHDFSKHAPREIVPRLRMLWSSIPAQLSKENKKFMYGLVKEGGRAKEFELALEWLQDSGLLYKVFRISKPGIPLAAYEDRGAFKIFISDTGLLGAMVNLNIKILLEGSSIFEKFKGALTEQYVFQQLRTVNSNQIYYWSAEKSSGEIDFVLQIENRVVPVEVKATENLQAKSLKAFCEKYRNNYAVRFSLSDYRKEVWIENIPLFAVHKIF
jgi:uncharacterized protein